MSLEPFLSNRANVAGAAGTASQPASNGPFNRLFGETARTDSAGTQQTRLDAPKVDLIEEDGRVASIVVTCRCCERIELACRY